MTRIALVVSDVDGTLLTKDKILTDKTARAVRQLEDSGVAFTIVSSRPDGRDAVSGRTIAADDAVRLVQRQLDLRSADETDRTAFDSGIGGAAKPSMC